MPTALRFIAAQGHRADIASDLPATTAITLDFSFVVNSITGARQSIFGTGQTNEVSDDWFYLFIEPDGLLRAVAGGSDASVYSLAAVATGEIIDVSWVITGMDTVSNATQGTGELFINGVSQGNNAKVNSDAFNNAVNWYFGSLNGWDLDADLISASVTADGYSHSWSADASNQTNTGTQPVLVDTVAANNATGVGFATDGSAFVTITDSTAPAVTLSADPKLGATLSFNYANYAGIPVGPLAFDQGARSLPDESVTITDNGDGTGSGVTDTALPDIPANGASVTPFPLIGVGIDITLPDPGA